MGRGFSEKLERAAQSKWAEYWLGTCAFFNSFILPIPAETLLIPLCLANPHRCWRYACIATIMAVLGGLAGYAIGAMAFAKIGSPIIEFYGVTEAFDQAKDQFNEAGTQWILLATISPLPYKVVTMTSGVTGMNLLVFLAASIIGRSIGYFLTAALLLKYGELVLRASRSPTIRLGALLVLFVTGYFLVF